MNKETLRMQMLAGIITEGQYKKLLEDMEMVNRILDKISAQGKDSLTPEEKEYLDKYSKGEKNMKKPTYFIAFNLPKDINSSEIIPLYNQETYQDSGDEGFQNLKDIADELSELNPKIDPKIFELTSGLYEDVIDDIEKGTKKEILPIYLTWLFRNLIWDTFRYSPDEADKRLDKYSGLEKPFIDNALKGKWMVIDGVTDDTISTKARKRIIDPNYGGDPDDIRFQLGF
jgi:Fe-S-cluster formation regulator IscX/YfhJ